MWIYLHWFCASPCTGMSQRDPADGSEVTRAGSTLGVPSLHIFSTANPKMGSAAGTSGRVGLALRFGLAAVTEGRSSVGFTFSMAFGHLRAKECGQPSWSGLLASQRMSCPYFPVESSIFPRLLKYLISCVPEEVFPVHIFQKPSNFQFAFLFDGIHRWHNKENEHVSVFLDISSTHIFFSSEALISWRSSSVVHTN